jgi:hypothetical protein
MNSPVRYHRQVRDSRPERPREPQIHSHVTDRIPDRHRLARARVRCDRCGSLLHLPSNRCMRTWVETGQGNFCMRCFVLAAGGATPDHRSQLAGVDCLPTSFGLTKGHAEAAQSLGPAALVRRS